MDQNSLQKALGHLPIAALRYVPSTGSTNDDALAWAAEDAPDMSLLVADHQTAGRGRLNRRWISQPGSSLIFSLILRPQQAEIRWLGLFSPLGGLAISSTLEEEFGLPSQVKWPNDVLVDGKKIAGVLAESIWEGSRAAAVVLGVGLNVTSAAIPPRNTLAFPAACLEDVLGRSVNRPDLLASLLRSLVAWRRELGSRAFFQAWEERLAFRGQVVQAEKDGKTLVSGRVLGLSPDGSLVLLEEDGSATTIEAGDVRLRPTIHGR